MKKNRLVSQEDEWGCGVACIASLLGGSYESAMAMVKTASPEPAVARFLRCRNTAQCPGTGGA